MARRPVARSAVRRAGARDESGAGGVPGPLQGEISRGPAASIDGAPQSTTQRHADRRHAQRDRPAAGLDRPTGADVTRARARVPSWLLRGDATADVRLDRRLLRRVAPRGRRLCRAVRSRPVSGQPTGLRSCQGSGRLGQRVRTVLVADPVQAGRTNEVCSPRRGAALRDIQYALDRSRADELPARAAPIGAEIGMSSSAILTQQPSAASAAVPQPGAPAQHSRASLAGERLLLATALLVTALFMGRTMAPALRSADLVQSDAREHTIWTARYRD